MLDVGVRSFMAVVWEKVHGQLRTLVRSTKYHSRVLIGLVVFCGENASRIIDGRARGRINVSSPTFRSPELAQREAGPIRPVPMSGISGGGWNCPGQNGDDRSFAFAPTPSVIY